MQKNINILMEPGEINVLVVNVMSLIRRIPIGQLSTFQVILDAARKHCDRNLIQVT